MNENIQKPINFYSSKDECKAIESKEKKQRKDGTLPITNPRYKNFFQTHFTAGDPDQFETFRNKTMLSMCSDIKEPVPLQDFKLKNITEQLIWPKYSKIESEDVKNTFNYIFDKFKKGLFTQIKNNQLSVFLPFSNTSFYNEWGYKMKVDPTKYKDFADFHSTIQRISGYAPNLHKINNNPYTWFSNNCLIRYEFPVNEGDTNVAIINDMFETLCKERKINDMEFFINRRDFPILKRNGTEAYSEIFDGDNVPLLSHSYSKYCPILSMVYTDEFADIPIPTYEDWSRVCAKENKFFVDSVNKSYDMTNLIWNSKKNTAVFRGSNTGCGVTIETNPRLKVAWLSIQKENIENKYIDAGITKWNTRPRKYQGNKYLQFPNPSELKLNLVDSKTPMEQSDYKYIIHIQGHVEAFRLSLELESGSCLLLVKSNYKLWYSHLLLEDVHYISVKSDLSDLFEKIKWCRENDSKCQEIAKNAYDFSKKYLSKESILNYLETILFRIKEWNGFYIYNSLSIGSAVQELELKKLNSEFFPTTEKSFNKILMQSRTFGSLKSFQYLLNWFIKNNKPFNKEEKLEWTKKINISKCTIDSQKFIKKTVKNVIHEYFIGSFAMNKLAMSIPNFIFTFGKSSDNKELFTEFVEGITLIDFITSVKFNMNTYISILIQVAFALEIAQKECLFTHYDLSPNNIVLVELKTPAVFQYKIKNNLMYSVETKFVPVIIDFQRSHAVVEGIKYSYKDLVSFSKIQDLFMLLVVCTKDIIGSKKLSSFEIEQLLYINNFITGTNFKKEKFMNIFDLKNFFLSRKYSNILFCEKKDLEMKSPFDFVKYIMGEKYRFKFDCVITKNNKIHSNHMLYGGNPLQLFNLYFASSKEEQIQTFLDFFERVLKSNFETTDSIGQVYCNIMFTKSVYVVFQMFLDFIKIIKGTEEDEKLLFVLYNKTIDRIKKLYPIQKSHIMLNVKKINSLAEKNKDENKNLFVFEKNVFDYNEDCFSNPIKILKFLNATNKTDLCLENINMFLEIFQNQDYLGNDNFGFETIFEVLDDSKLLNCFSIIMTVRKLSKNIANSDIEAIEATQKNCLSKPDSEVENFLKYFEALKQIRN